MKKKIAAFALALAMLAGLTCMPVFAAGAGAANGNPAEHWFYDQLTAQGKAIYDAIADMYGSGMMEDGKTSYDLVAKGVVGKSVVESYLDGNRTLFNDFAAAKDAFDLEHPEAWYFDSSMLSFRVTTEENGTVHAYMGPGRAEDYYVVGVAGKADVASKTSELDKAVGAIVSGAQGKSAYEKVRYVHDQITHSISYRFENECTKGNAGYIRTAYALVTHEGVCEGYARSFQYVMNELNIPCVLIHGMQTSGEPEEHMWCAVQLEGKWYVVDPTWDDPVGLDAEGKIKAAGKNGSDGGETETYLLVGQNIVGANWQPSGYVSSSATAFEYPEIALLSYGSGAIEQNGLKVEYANDMMEGSGSTVYHVSFNGEGLVKSAEKGYYFLVKMYDVNADGSVDEFDDWYYSVHGLHGVQSSFDPDNNFQNGGNQYFADTDEYLIYNIINCEYVEFAITTKAPPAWKSADDLRTMGGYYSGDYSDILAETGLIFNVNGSYEQPPYVRNASPDFTSSIRAGVEYTIHIEFSDPLYHPSQNSINQAPAGKTEDAPEAMKQTVGMDYRGKTYAWGMNARQPHTFADKPEPQNIRWICETHRTHNGFAGINDKCKLTAIEYEFTSSKMWADDSCQYEFYLTGLVGTKSNKFPNSWSYVFENKYPFWTCPLYSGFTWNLWGQPQLLDNPDDLDFEKLVVRGVDGAEKSLKELHDSMKLDDKDMNGRIVLSVQNIGESRSKTEELAQAISDSEKVNIPEEAVLGSSLFEIDFARICRCTVVETGQSLRLCVGFPPGIDAGMAGVVFKAYHFTRDIEGSCPTPKDPKHVHTGEIYSVEEIPITVTEYGLVITCSKFSPFEIVALDAEAAGLEVDDGHYVILTGDGNGKVTSAAADKNNMVAFKQGDKYEFTVTPDEGYVLDTVTIGGNTKIVVVDNKFELSYDDVAAGSAILKVTFVPASVKQAEEEAGETVAEPKVCSHTNTSGKKYQAATCTEDGWTDGLTCNDCHMVLSVSEAIPALGHTYVDGACVRCDAEEPGTPSKPNPSTPSQPVNGASGSAAGGSWTTDVSAARKGDTVTVTSRASQGYISAAPVVKDKNGNTVDVVKNANGVWSFTMPEGGVTITGSYITPAQKFGDLNDSKWYRAEIAYVIENGLMNGVGGGRFDPDAPTTRGMIMTILARQFGVDTTPADGEAWYQKGMDWAMEAGVSDGSDPKGDITREQLAAMLWRFMDRPPVTGDLSAYPDAGDIHTSWAGDAMIWAVQNGIIKGSGGRLNPRGNASRIEAAAMLSRFCQNILQQ